MSKSDVSELFESMGREHLPPEPASLREQRRKRVVGEMRQLHVRLVHERGPGTNVRRLSRVLLVAAAVAFAGVAFARLGGVGPWGSPRPPARPKPVLVTPPVTRAALPSPARSATPIVAPVAPSEPSLPRESAAPSNPPGLVQGARRVPSDAARHERTSNLEAINRLFADAKQARRDGHDRQALALLDELLKGYPHSVLAQEASVERFRVLSRLGRRSEAEREAESYLERYPSGFAREEARRLTAGSARP